jgi:hypothetical protein
VSNRFFILGTVVYRTRRGLPPRDAHVTRAESKYSRILSGRVHLAKDIILHRLNNINVSIIYVYIYTVVCAHSIKTLFVVSVSIIYIYIYIRLSQYKVYYILYIIYYVYTIKFRLEKLCRFERNTLCRVVSSSLSRFSRMIISSTTLSIPPRGYIFRRRDNNIIILYCHWTHVRPNRS